MHTYQPTCMHTYMHRRGIQRERERASERERERDGGREKIDTRISQYNASKYKYDQGHPLDPGLRGKLTIAGS